MPKIKFTDEEHMNDIYWIILAVIFGLCFTGAFLYTLFLAKKNGKNKDKE